MPLLMAPVALAVLAACFIGAGRLLPGDRPWPERFAAGAMAAGVAVQALAWASALSGAALWALLAAGALATLLPGSGMRPPGWHVAVPLLLLLPLAAMPQSARDAMNHHLYLPRLWLESGSMYRGDWCRFFSYPALVESLYALLGGTLGFGSSGVLSLAGLLAATGAAVQGRRGLDAATAALVLLSIPEVLRNATWAYSDSFLLLFSILTAREAASESPDPVRLALWGSGAAMCKYNGLVVTALALAAACARARRGVPAALLLTALLSATWALPNLVEHGNPFHPLPGSLLNPGGNPRTEALLRDYRDYTASLDSPADVLTLPLDMSVNGVWDDPRRFDGATGPLLLLGTFLFAAAGRRRGRLAAPLLTGAAILLLTAPAVRARYMFPALGMLAVLAGEGLAAVLRMKGVVRTAALVSVAACTGWSGSWLARLYARERPWEAVDADFLERRLPYMEFYRQAGGVLGRADTTLFVNMGNRAFYFPSFVIYNDRRFPLLVLEPLWEGCTADGLEARLRAMGVRYLAMDMDVSQANIVPELDDAQLAEWRVFLAGLEPLVSSGPYILFRLVE